MTGFLISIVPTAGVLFMFWVVIRALVQADRRERAAQARLDAEQAPAAAVQTRSDASAGRADVSAGSVGRPDAVQRAVGAENSAEAVRADVAREGLGGASHGGSADGERADGSV